MKKIDAVLRKEHKRQSNKKYAEENKERIKEYKSKWHADNKERIRANQRTYRAKNLDAHHGYELKFRQGITMDQKYSMALVQDWKCYICKREMSPDTLVVDHDHDKLKGEGIRKLLCSSCNQGLGRFKDSSTLLYVAAKYLEDFGK